MANDSTGDPLGYLTGTGVETGKALQPIPAGIHPNMNPNPKPDFITANGARPFAEPDESPFHGASTVPFEPVAIAMLRAPVPEDQVAIRPDGMVFWPGVYYRERLHDAFGVGGWALVPRGEWYNSDDNQVYYRGALFVQGRFVAEAVGEAQYFPDNANQTYATALESAKTNALVRTCKDLGMAAELWRPGYADTWRSKHAVEVWCEHAGTPKPGQPAKKKLWRLLSASPIDTWPYREQPGGRHAPPGNTRNEGSSDKSRKAPATGFQGQGVQSTGQTSENATAGTQGGKNTVPDRPWSPEVLTQLLKMRSAKLDVEFLQVTFDTPSGREEAEDMAGIKALRVLLMLCNGQSNGSALEPVPDDYSGDMGTAVLQHLFGSTELTYGQCQALWQWATGGKHPDRMGMFDIDTAAQAEFAKLRVLLTTTGAYTPLRQG